jgi:hypothetical protein
MMRGCGFRIAKERGPALNFCSFQKVERYSEKNFITIPMPP